jgi:hypothetical protein
MRTGLSTVLCLCLLFISIAPGQSSDQEIIDLTTTSTIKPKKRSKDTGTISSALSSHSIKKMNVPLKAELLGFDKAYYYLGENVIYEVQLSNISGSNIVIPCSPNVNEVKSNQDGGASNYLKAALSLVVKDKIGGDQFVATQILYGSETIPVSLKILLPGQSVIFRVPGRWEFSDAEVAQRLKKSLPQRFETRARFAFLEPSDLYLPAISKNSLNIELDK